MSGGAFGCNQDRIKKLIEDIRRELEPTNFDEYVCQKSERDICQEVRKEFENGLRYLKIAYIYAEEIDLFVSADTGPDSFLLGVKDALADTDNVYARLTGEK